MPRSARRTWSRLYDAGQQREEVYYSMEYLPGGSVAAPAEPLDRDTALKAMAHAARATHALHEAGIAHRDIKPGNVLLYPGGAKLADLGLSHVLRPGITITRMGPAGDIGYLDPGLIRGDWPSRASDVFSLGATLHYALSRRGPVRAAVRRRPAPGHAPRHLPPARHLRRSVDPVREVIAWATAANPAKRPATALQLAERIEDSPWLPLPAKPRRRS